MSFGTKRYGCHCVFDDWEKKPTWRAAGQAHATCLAMCLATHVDMCADIYLGATCLDLPWYGVQICVQACIYRCGSRAIVETVLTRARART